VDVISGAQLWGSEEQLLEPAPTGCATDVQPQAVDSADDEVRIQKERWRARINSPVSTHRRTSGYCSGRASPENSRRTGTDEERGQGKVRGHLSSSKRRIDDNITVRRRHCQSRSHSSDREQRRSAGPQQRWRTFGTSRHRVAVPRNRSR